jgi:hypothetical protein
MALKSDAALRKDRTNAADLSTLQHRHYAAIAGIIHDLDFHQNVKFDIARAFADRLATNARFDRKRFMVACGVVELV